MNGHREAFENFFIAKRRVWIENPHEILIIDIRSILWNITNTFDSTI